MELSFDALLYPADCLKKPSRYIAGTKTPQSYPGKEDLQDRLSHLPGSYTIRYNAVGQFIFSPVEEGTAVVIMKTDKGFRCWIVGQGECRTLNHNISIPKNMQQYPFCEGEAPEALNQAIIEKLNNPEGK